MSLYLSFSFPGHFIPRSVAENSLIHFRLQDDHCAELSRRSRGAESTCECGPSLIHPLRTLTHTSKHKHRGHIFMIAELEREPVLESSRRRSNLCTARPLIAFLSLTFQPTKCKLPMSKGADKSEVGEIDRTVVPLSREKAHTIIFQSRPRFGLRPPWSSDCAKGKCSRRGAGPSSSFCPPSSCSHSVSWHLQSPVSSVSLCGMERRE